MSSPLILKVALNVPLSRAFDYLADGSREILPGTRVCVPFGRRHQVGLVLEVGHNSDIAPDKLKSIESVLDDEPLLTEENLWLVRFTADYYHHPIGEVVAAALPVLLRRDHPLHDSTEHIALSSIGQSVDIESLARRAPKQAEVLTALLDAGDGGIAVTDLTEQLPNWRRAAKVPMGNGWLEKFDARTIDHCDDNDVVPIAGPTLNREQQAAVDHLRLQDSFGVHLLDGVTGSGKTEVYLQLIEDKLRARQQVLVLVPEIGLTPQLVSRLQARFGVMPTALHSGLGNAQRLAAWRRARAGDALLLVGTRSAIFTPLPKLSLIVVDEEHDASLKQQEGLRYSARDLAIVRGKQDNVPVILGSATPSVEILQHCFDGNFSHLVLGERAGGAQPPLMRLVDTSRAPVSNGLSESLAAAIQKHLDADGQVLLFLNRRGFAPTLICPTCSHVSECDRCDSRMTVHAKFKALRCHHCGAQRPLPETCVECGGELRPLGAGTERLEDALLERFPERNVSRIDSDSTQRRGAIDDALEAATLGKADILVGTQMLSKGHHFPKLTLVAVIDADQGLFGTDFRSDERMAQSIIQVAGRAGREQVRGEVLIQTGFPQHAFWRRLIEEGYSGIATQVLAERQATQWPPFSRLALLRAAAHRREDAHALLELARRIAADLGQTDVRLLGPVDAVMARKAGRYRAQLLIQSQDRPALHRVLHHIRHLLEAAPAARKVRWSIDVDPIELF